VLSREDLLKLLDRRDVTWGASSSGKGEGKTGAPQAVPGLFKVLTEEDTSSSLPSLKQ
jgi:hypothetical protein